MGTLEGKIAIVTGAASGMGRAFAERFGRAGMNVVLADVEGPKLDEAVGRHHHPSSARSTLKSPSKTSPLKKS